MALANTTLAAAMLQGDTTLRVTSATGFGDKQVIRVDNEFMAQAGAATGGGTVIPVRRGIEGTAQVAHGILAAVVTGLPGDFPAPPAGHFVTVPPTVLGHATLGADTALTAADYPVQDLTYHITKATAAAITLGAPSVASTVRLTFLSATAAAHTVTFTAGYYGDTTGSDIATFAAKAGASMTIEARAGTWGVIALGNVTIA